MIRCRTAPTPTFNSWGLAPGEFNMKVTIPAIRGTMGGRHYFNIMVSLAEVPRLFKFNDWEQCTPELRAQRVLNKSRVPDIVKYILDNEDSYLFSAITASYQSDVRFIPASEGADIGTLEMELENLELVINDGQHRSAGIAAAVKENPAIGRDKISVLLFPFENLERVQQMFTDLNRFAHKTSKSLDILYDHRDNLSALVMELAEEVDVFRDMVDREKITIPLRSPRLFTLATLYDATAELLGADIDRKGTPGFAEKLKVGIDYWTALADVIPDWKKAKEGDIKPAELRQEKINTHAVILRALGGVGRALLDQHADDWQQRVQALCKIDWRKSVKGKVNPLWDNVCISAGSVVSNRQARGQTLAILMDAVGIERSTREEKAARARSIKLRSASA